MTENFRNEVVATAENVIDIKKIFRSIDIDRSGSIEQSELKIALEKYGVNTSNLHSIFLLADIDGNGTVSEEEFLLLWKKLTQPPTESKPVEDDSLESKNESRAAFIPTEPKTQKASKRIYVKRELSVLHGMNISSQQLQKAMATANTLSEDFYDESDTDSVSQEKRLLEISNRLHTRKTLCLGTKLRQKFPLKKPKQLGGVEPSKFKKQCQDMRTNNQALMYSKAVKTIMKMRKMKESDFEASVLQKFDIQASAYNRACYVAAAFHVKSWLSSSVEKIGYLRETAFQRAKAEEYKRLRAVRVLEQFFYNYKKVKFKMKSIHAIVIEHRRRIARIEREDVETFQQRMSLRLFDEKVDWIKFQLRRPRPSSPPQTHTSISFEEANRPDLAPFSNQIIQKFRAHKMKSEHDTKNWVDESLISESERIRILSQNNGFLRRVFPNPR